MVIAVPPIPSAQSARNASVGFEPLDIAVDRCKGCGLCVAICPKGILELDGSTVNELGHHPIRLLDVASCTSCALCARICPDTVFAVYARPRRT